MFAYFLPFIRYPFTGEATDCPVCGSGEHQRICGMDRKLKRLDTDICNACGLFFHNPMPTDAELARYYAETYRFEYQFLRRRPARGHVARKQHEAKRRYEQAGQAIDLAKPLTTLDFGCGSGELVAHFAEQGHDAHGLEPGESFAEHAATSAGTGTIRTEGWSRESYPEGKFDLITCLHVLEHLNRPIEALSCMRDWLAPGGVLFLEVPDMTGYSNKGFDRFHFAHTLGFSRDNLILALREAGMAPVALIGATSVIAARASDPRALNVTLDLAATAQENRAAYGAPFSLSRHLKHHWRRAKRLIGREIRPEN